MKSNSDESDYEGESFDNNDNDEGTEEKDAYPQFINGDRHNIRKRHATMSDEASQSDSNDSEDDEDYYNEKDNAKSKSHKMYQDLSAEQDSGDECSNQNVGNGSMDDQQQNSNDEAEEDSYLFNKRQRLHRTKTKSDKDTGDKEKDSHTKEQLSKQEPNSSQDKVQRMMRIMGYKEGHGLGKNKQGRLEPVQASKQHGRRGLGHHVPGLEASGLKWDAGEEEIKVVEDMERIRCLEANLPTLEEMQHWLRTGPKKLTIEDETNFCHEEIVKNIIDGKTAFENLDDVEMRRARTRCNPYETIRGAFFLNRAAVKMANIDRACNFMFTEPKCLEKKELLYFADVCAGPGGFSEYVLWKKKWHAKGFGFTLKNENDFKLGDFYAGPCETFHPFYGPKDNGDVFDPSNQEAFRDLIMAHTHGKGVHFMMSDGGFSVKGQESIQEILSKQLYLCQCLVALMIVRVKGHFVTKLFDLLTPFSAGLVYLMYRCFEEVCIFKPNSSRPANSERYLICKYKRAGTNDIVQHLKRVNQLLLKGESDNDVLQLVSFEELEREKQFVQYLRKSNDVLGKKQIVALRKIAAFCEDTSLVETKQADMRRECLKYWNLPDESRRMPRCMKPHDKLQQLLTNTPLSFSRPANVLTVDNIANTILNPPYNWFCMPCGTKRCTEENTNATFYLGMGRSKVYRYMKGTWIYVDNINIELPPDTLVYAEVVYEMTKESKYLQKVLALHILDAFILGGENICNRYLTERHGLIKKFCEALWKPAGSNYARIRAKELFPVKSNLCQKLKVTKRLMKNNRIGLVYELVEPSLDCTDVSDKPYFVLNSILFLKSTAYPWSRYYSKTQSLTYVFNCKTGEQKFDSDRPQLAEANFVQTFQDRVFWYWSDDESLTMDTFAKFIEEKCPPYDLNLRY